MPYVTNSELDYTQTLREWVPKSEPQKMLHTLLLQVNKVISAWRAGVQMPFPLISLAKVAVYLKIGARIRMPLNCQKVT